MNEQLICEYTWLLSEGRECILQQMLYTYFCQPVTNNDPLLLFKTCRGFYYHLQQETEAQLVLILKGNKS